MTSEQINIAIAEACNKVIVDKWGEKYPIPDYCNDLNGMHDAENRLNDEQKERYFLNLMCLYGNWPKAIQATSKERSEAFLKTIGKWEE